MLTIILLLIFASGMAYFSFQNSAHVTLTFFNYTVPEVSLFLVILGSMLVGALLVYVIHLVNSISTAITIHGKDKKIEKSQEDVTQLTKKTHQLELENESLKKDNPAASYDDKSL